MRGMKYIGLDKSWVRLMGLGLGRLGRVGFEKGWD